MNSPEFYDVPTEYEEAKRLGYVQRGTTVDRFYEVVTSLPTNPFSDLLHAERQWHDLVQPQFKIFPAMQEALERTQIQVDCARVTLPFPVFALRFPKQSPLVESGGPHIRAALLWAGVNRAGYSGPTTHFLNVAVRWVDDAGVLRPVTYRLELTPGLAVGEQFDKLRVMYMRPEGLSEQLYVPSIQMLERILRVTIGTAFLAVGRVRVKPERQPIVRPEIPPRCERRRFEKETGRKGTRKRTFTVGRDIVVPRSERRTSTQEAGQRTAERRHAHWRCGHLRLQPSGPVNGPNSYDWIFIEPTLVRPDLPHKPNPTPYAVNLFPDTVFEPDPRVVLSSTPLGRPAVGDNGLASGYLEGPKTMEGP